MLVRVTDCVQCFLIGNWLLSQNQWYFYVFAFSLTSLILYSWSGRYMLLHSAHISAFLRLVFYSLSPYLAVFLFTWLIGTVGTYLQFYNP